jgi:hypothetical protein
VAVVIFNEGQPGRMEAFLGTLGGPGIGIPVIGSSYAIGDDLATNAASTRLFVNAVSLEALEVNSDAVAYATLNYAMSTELINGDKSKGNFKPATETSES